MENQENQVIEQEAPKWTEDELISIFDDIIFQGSYSESKSFKKGRLTATFTTRSAGEQAEITKLLDQEDNKLVATFNQRYQILSLAYALVNFNGKDMLGLTREERIRMVEALATPVVILLVSALMEFDEKVSEACRIGEENF